MLCSHKLKPCWFWKSQSETEWGPRHAPVQSQQIRELIIKDTTWTQQQRTESHMELMSFLLCSCDVCPALTPLFVGFGLESCLTVGWLVMVLPLKAGVPTADHLYHPGGQWSDCWSVVWLLAICIIHVVSGVTVGYLYHPGGQWCDCWLSLSPRWSVVWLLAIFIIQVVSGVIAGHLYHPGGQWCDCWLSVLSIWQWCDCWLSVSSRWSVVWLLTICITKVVSGVIAGYLYHPGGQWWDCWLSVCPFHQGACSVCDTGFITKMYSQSPFKTQRLYSFLNQNSFKKLRKKKGGQWTFQLYDLRRGCSRGH